MRALTACRTAARRREALGAWMALQGTCLAGAGHPHCSQARAYLVGSTRARPSTETTRQERRCPVRRCCSPSSRLPPPKCLLVSGCCDLYISTSGLCLQAFQTTAATVGAWHARTRLTPTRAPTLPPPPTVRHAGGRSDSWDKLLTAAEERVAVKQEMCECWYTIFILLLSVGTNTMFPTSPPPPGRLRTLSSYSPRGDGSCLRPVLRDRGEGKALSRGQRQTTVGGGAAAGARRRPSPATLLRLPPLLQNLEQMRGVVEKACRC